MTEQNSMKISMTIDKRDLDVYSRFLIRIAEKILPEPEKGQWHWAVVTVSTVIFLSCLSVTVLFFVRYGATILAANEILMPILLCVFMYFVTSSYMKVLRGRHSLQRRNRPARGGVFLNQFRYDFDESGLSCKGPGTESEYKWPAFLAIFETADHFFLMLDRVKAVVLPKRAFADHGDLDTFRDLAAQGVGEVRQA